MGIDIENEIIKEEKKEIRTYDNRINNVAKIMAEKMKISIEKAEIELRMGIVMGMMMNRHRAQEINEK